MKWSACFFLFCALLGSAPAQALPVRTAFCSQATSGGNASCTITLIPGQMVVVSGSAFAAYGMADTTGLFPQGLFQYFQQFIDPNSTFSITVGTSISPTLGNSGPDTFTVNQTQFSLGASIIVTQWSGLTSTFTPDSNVGNTGTASGSGNITGGNLTTSVTGDLLITVALAANNGQTFALGAGYSQDENFNYTESAVLTFVAVIAEHQVAGAAGAYPANVTVSASGPWAIVGISLLPSSLPTGTGKKRQPFIVKHQKKNPAKPAILVAANNAQR